MANVIGSNFGAFSVAGDFLDSTSGGGVTFSAADYASVLGWPNGGGKAMVVFGLANSQGLGTKTIASQATYTVHVRAAKSLAATIALLQFRESGTIHVAAQWNADGTFSLLRGATVLATGTTSYDRTVSHHLGLQATIADSGGSATLWVNGAQEVTFSGDTRNGGTGVINELAFVAATASMVTRFTDLWLNNASGAQNAGYDGPLRVVLARPSANGASGVAFTPSAGANWQNVDDPIGIHDGDGTYNEATAAGAIDWLSVPSSEFSGMSGTIVGASLAHWARATDAGVHATRGKTKKGGTVTNGASHALTNTYARYQDTFPLDPATGAVWASFAAVAAAEWGYEMVS